jgi:hypothetical protein
VVIHIILGYLEVQKTYVQKILALNCSPLNRRRRRRMAVTIIRRKRRRKRDKKRSPNISP